MQNLLALMSLAPSILSRLRDDKWMGASLELKQELASALRWAAAVRFFDEVYGSDSCYCFISETAHGAPLVSVFYVERGNVSMKKSFASEIDARRYLIAIIEPANYKSSADHIRILDRLF